MAQKYDRMAFITFTASIAYIPMMMIALLIISIIDSATGATESTVAMLLDRHVWAYCLITGIWIVGLLVSAWFDRKADKLGYRR